MLTETLIVAACVMLGAVLVYVCLHAIYKKNLTTMLWLRLIPGIFGLCVTLFVLGKLGAFNTKALVLCFFIGVTLMVGNFVIVGTQLVRRIDGLVHRLNDASSQMASASGQVAQSSQQMAEGANHQASSLEEISSSLEEMSSMTRHNAENAKHADQMAGDAKAAAEKSQESMGHMSEAIARIKSSSDQTGKILKTIDEIAFQTNLLALNAAVEAARAGEAGKGFAVVAEEVRNLAQRSAEAAKNTAALIEESLRNSEDGVKVSEEVKVVLSEILESVRKVTEFIGEVSAASSEQAQGIDQVNSAVVQVNQVTQSNAANAEESASASEELSSQSSELRQIVSVLVGMVGGRAKNGSKDQGEAFLRRTVTKKQTPGISPPDRRNAPKTSASRAGAMDPEKVIPLEDSGLSGF